MFYKTGRGRADTEFFTNSKQQTANSKQQTANSEQRTAIKPSDYLNMINVSSF